MLTVGELRPFSGNVTTLNLIGVRLAEAVERNLGYGPGRLAPGYWVPLLKQQLTPGHFEFDGTTLRSGGRLGLPGATTASDAARMRVHDQIISQRGAGGYAELQKRVLRGVPLYGPDRIAKVIPATPHDGAMSPASQYPMGGGGLQWTIKRDRPCSFLVAMQVGPSGIAQCPDFEVSLTSGGFDQLQASRRKMREWLEAHSVDRRRLRGNGNLAFARLTASIAEKLANGMGVVAMPQSNQVTAYETSADSSWSPWVEDVRCLPEAAASTGSSATP